MRAHRWTIRSWMLALVGLTASLGGCAAYYDPYGVDDGYGAYGYDDDFDVYAYPGYGYPYDGYRDPFAYRAPFIGPYGDPGAFPYGYPFPPVRHEPHDGREPRDQERIQVRATPPEAAAPPVAAHATPRAAVPEARPAEQPRVHATPPPRAHTVHAVRAQPEAGTPRVAARPPS